MGADGSAAVADADLAADLRDPGYHHHCKNRDYHISSAESENTTIGCVPTCLELGLDSPQCLQKVVNKNKPKKKVHTHDIFVTKS